MRYQDINIVGEEYADDNRHWSSQHCINYLPVPAERGGTLTQWQLRQAPGLRPLVRIIKTHGTPDVEEGPIRGMREVEGKLFVVAGTTLYQISNSLVAIPYGTIPGVSRVSMAHNQRGLGNELLIATGSAGYVFNTSTLVLQKITDEAYPGAFIAAYIDSYIAQVEPQGRYWFHSDLADALSYNSLDRYEAEGQPDRIVSLYVSHREALLFGRETIEPYVNEPSGDGTAPFQRASNTVIECGCSARYSVAGLDNSVMFLDDKRIVRRLDSYNPVRISTQPIEQALAECSAEQISAAFAFVWEDKGHKVYYLTVPGRFTFGYDVLSRRWHRRLTKGMDRWRLSGLVFWNGMWVGGDYQSGRLYALDWKYGLDGQNPNGEPLELVRNTASGYLSANQNRLRVHAVEVRCRVGSEETVPVQFPEQPEAPTISGDASNATVGIPWAGFTYTATGGTPPYRFSLRSGSLPTGFGPLSPSGSLPAVTPEEVSSGAFVVRVTDANGLYADLDDSIAVGEGWLLAASFTDTGELKRSPEGVSWDSPSFRVMDGEDTWQPYFEGTAFSRSGAEVIGYSGIGFRGIWSTDHGKTFAALPIPGSVINGFRCAKVGPLWWIPRGNVTDVATWDGNTIEDGPFQASAVLEYGGNLFSARVFYGYLYNRGEDGTGTGEVLFTGSGSSLINIWLEKSDDEIAILWLDVSGNLHIERSIDGGASVETCASPFSAAPGDTKCFARFNRRESLWVIVFGNRVAYGPDLTALVQSSHVFATTPRGLDEDGTKFVVCGDDRLLESSVDGDIWVSEPTPGDTISTTDLAAVLAPSYEVEE